MLEARRTARLAAGNLLLAALYFGTGLISLLISGRVVSANIFLPEGLALAAVLVLGPRMLPGILMGQTLLALHFGTTWPIALGIGAVNAAEGALAWTLCQRMELDRRLRTLHDLAALLLMILLILQPFSALLGNLLLVGGGFLHWNDYWPSTFQWWLGNVMGQFLLTPTLLRLQDRHRRPGVAEGMAVFIFFAALGAVFQNALPIHNPYLLLLPTLLPALLLTIQRGMAQGGIAVWGVTASTLLLLTSGQEAGFLAQGDRLEQLINFDFYVLAHLMVILVIGVLFHEKQRTIRELKAMAHRDGLTGLPNRTLLWKQLKRVLQAARLEQNHAAVCFLDIDGFKEVNDRLGHPAGDEVLKAVAFRVGETLRTSDHMFRLGGNEFIILLTGLDDDQDLESLLDKILDRVRHPIPVGNRRVRVSATLGVALYPDDAVTPSELVLYADNAMYRAKRLGKNRHMRYREPEASRFMEEPPPDTMDQWSAKVS